MDSTFATYTSADKKGKYNLLISQVYSLIEDEPDRTANLSNVTAAIKQTFPGYSWVGFYLRDRLKPDELVLGPFQGKPACTRLRIGKGVCGTAVERAEIIIVDDVDKFPGHIYCDSESRSEIVVPVIKNNEVIGVLDIDSLEYSAFDKTDSLYLEQLVKKIIGIF